MTMWAPLLLAVGIAQISAYPLITDTFGDEDQLDLFVNKHRNHDLYGRLLKDLRFLRHLVENAERSHGLVKRDATAEGGVRHILSKRAVRNVSKRDATAEGGARHILSKRAVRNVSKRDATAEGGVRHILSKRAVRNVSKRDTTVEGHVDHDESGTNVGGSVTHETDGGTSINAHIDHHSQDGTSFGVGAGHTWDHGDGSQTSIHGTYDHDSDGGDSVGVGITHTFGKRFAELERMVRDLHKRDTIVSGSVEHDDQGTHASGKVEHTSDDKNTHVEAHIDHDSNSGTSYGGSFSHTFDG